MKIGELLKWDELLEIVVEYEEDGEVKTMPVRAAYKHYKTNEGEKLVLIPQDQLGSFSKEKLLDIVQKTLEGMKNYGK